MEERIIVTLTTYSKRIGNIPTILETIFKQTIPPDFVVLNLAYEEVVPDEVQKYINEHAIEVNRVPDSKVYKKILPTLKKYPNDCVICIDDDWLYPSHMIEDFIAIHKHYPDNPISGATFVNYQTMTFYHNGCASLVKLSYFEGLLDNIDEDLIRNCPSDDYVFTYFANKAGHPYVRTTNKYYIDTMQPYNEGEGYSASMEGGGGRETWSYLENRFGKAIDHNIYHGYIQDQYISDIVYDINRKWQDKLEQIESSRCYILTIKIRKVFYRFTNLLKGK